MGHRMTNPHLWPIDKRQSDRLRALSGAGVMPAISGPTLTRRARRKRSARLAELSAIL